MVSLVRSLVTASLGEPLLRQDGLTTEPAQRTPELRLEGVAKGHGGEPARSLLERR